jgi:hypothetical protein
MVTNNNIIEQINIFNYPGCSVSYQNEKDITVKISKVLQIMGIVELLTELKTHSSQKHTRLKIYNILALPTLLHGCETWAITEHDKPRM